MGKGKVEIAECCKTFGKAGIGVKLLKKCRTEDNVISFFKAGVKHCGIENNVISVWLIVSGLSPIMLGCFARKREEGDNSAKVLIKLAIFLFIIAWLTLGSIFIFPNFARMNSRDYSSLQETFDLIRFLVATVIIDWILLVVWVGMATEYIQRASQRRSSAVNQGNGVAETMFI